MERWALLRDRQSFRFMVLLHYLPARPTVENLGSHRIDYRLNILGIRVWEHSCQLIARSGQECGIIGLRDLPAHVPKVTEELKTAAAGPLLLTAYPYCGECPGSDLPKVLNETLGFASALNSLSSDGTGEAQFSR